MESPAKSTGVGSQVWTKSYVLKFECYLMRSVAYLDFLSLTICGTHCKDIPLVIGRWIIHTMSAGLELNFMENKIMSSHVSIIMDFQKQEAVARDEEFKKLVAARMVLRHNNLNPERPDSRFLRTLDSSIKYKTALIKKLKQINEAQIESLMDELRSVNLGKFVSEAVTAICDAKLRSSDLQAAVQVCSSLHQRYTDFSAILTQGLLKVFLPGKTGDELEADRNLTAMKKRITLKLLLELYFVGVVEDGDVFISIIEDLTSVENLKDRDATQTNLSLLTSFTRQGQIFLGLPLSGHEILDEFYKGLNISADQKEFFTEALHSYYNAATDLLQLEHTSLCQMELENAEIMSDENASLYEKLRKSYDHLYRGVSALAEALDIEPPVMAENGHITRVTTGDIAGIDSSILEALWDDEDTRGFYECLPDLRVFLPAVLLGEAGSEVHEQSLTTQEQPSVVTWAKGQHPHPGERRKKRGKSATREKGKANHNSLPQGLASKSDQGQMATPDFAEDSVTSQEGEFEKDEKDQEKTKDPDKEKGKVKDTGRRGKGKHKIQALEGTNLHRLLQRLPCCVSRDQIDQLTVEFCYINSKSNRKKLVRALFNVPRTCLLPYYSRMVATLSTYMKDVSSMLLQSLEEAFNLLITKKDEVKIQTKIRNIRFIGELCKFRIASAGLVFNCLKACLDDFSHHNIEVACNLLETCGRFLYRSPETTVRMANILEILMRLKNTKNLDPHHITIVENAYYSCKPPKRSTRVPKVRPPLHQYIRKLLFSDLDKSSTDHVLQQLHRLPWSECESYLLKCFMKVHKGKYGQIHLIASLTAGLSHYHDEFAVAVVDEVLEEIRVGLELNGIGMQQRRIAHMRFLGELYNYEQLNSSVIFDTLYLILFFGHGKAEQDVLDPLEDCFRIRMVITLLHTCGHCFDRGSSKRKLDEFLLHFQSYILCKGSIPLDIEFDLQDLFADLRQNMMPYSSIEEVNDALIEFVEHERIVSIDEANCEKHSDMGKPPFGNTSCTISVNGHNLPLEENGVVHRDIYSGSGTIDPNGRGVEEGLHEENHDDVCNGGDDYGDGGALAIDEDEEVRVWQYKVMDVNPEEEAEFDRELRSLMQESLDSRKLEPRSRLSLNMAIPMNVVVGPTEDLHGRKGLESGDETLDEEAGGRRIGRKEVSVRVLVKRGNKQRSKQLYLPLDCSLVRSAKEREAAEVEERKDIKRLVLEYNEREEESCGFETQPTSWMQSVDSNGDVKRIPGSHHRHQYFAGAGFYYRRRK
ncbi:hypothetical protein RHMOL_Rhmol09G0215800 [Rhododendron molle]|uniref:Uncharacterized protein n=1 Tax=Rhododendron molle TaxID=49168 RepID=A0ACC0MFW7_RHOML|nr:hypothetical protein RHMOL_Rhmol09G0215800 [Rhododendron molle]